VSSAGVDGWQTPPRRAVGRVLLDGPLGESAIVRATAGDPGNTGKLLRRMEAEGWVEIEREGRPRIWRLAPGQDENLRHALEESQPVGELTRGQRVLLVDLGEASEAALARALRRRSLLGGVAWTAKVEGARAQYLIVLDRDASALETSVIAASLDAVDIRCTRVLVEEVQTPDAFVRTLSALRGIGA
jgi:DNA-binding MarR family transcriptional regulator